jgi:hypothetical protein
MKYSITLTTALLCFCLFSSHAQKELLDGFFEKEAPRFTPRIEAMQQDGSSMLIYYFTHSKASNIEASVWIKDLGTNLSTQADKQLISDLQMLGNRQIDTIVLQNLKEGHFYAIGLDYRLPNAINRKFVSKVLREAYRYEGLLSTRNVPQPAEKIVLPKPTPSNAVPCVDPDLFVKIDPAGYCGTSNRPAVLIQCENCQGKNWEFSVEVRTEYGDWQPLRSDGMAHTALGASVRTEPLCVLAPDNYYIRVLAWGENCKTPVVNTIGTSISIGNQGVQPTTTFSEPPSPPSFQEEARKAVTMAPETCGVIANASLEGSYIRGTVTLPLESECAEGWRSHIMLSYIHPGYRDINLEPVSLYSGIEMPFAFELDQQDLQRGIHTLKATVFISRDGYARPIPTETFWIRANENNPSSAINPNLAITPTQQDPVPEYDVLEEQKPGMTGTITKSGVEWEDDFSIDESLYDEHADALSVTATDPNCNQIFDLKLVASPTQPEKPLFISWLNPRCCQEQGCAYTLWAGPSVTEVSLVVKGNKAGARVSELIAAPHENARYYEVVVKTPNGNRKAAYILGEGPIYGVEAVLAYRDGFQPQRSDSIKALKEVPKGASAVGGGLASRVGNTDNQLDDDAAGLYHVPKLPISKFRACKYARKTSLEAEEPIYEGDEIQISYDFSEPGHEYTLYHQPPGSDDWFIAPGTVELQDSPVFELEAQSYHSGKYIILVHRKSKNWGCLSSPLDKTIEINVIR